MRYFPPRLPSPTPRPAGTIPTPPVNLPAPVPPAKSIDTYTGNEPRVIDDLKVWGGVGEHQLVLSRYANSRFTNTTTTFGNGNSWRHSYQWEISVASTDQDGPYKVEIYYPDGSHNSFYRHNPTTYGSTPNITDVLRINGAHDTFTLQRQDGYQYVFQLSQITPGNYRWRLNYFLDSQQNAYTCSYNISNQLIRVTEPAGRYLQFTYSLLSFLNAASTQIGKTNTPVAGWNTIASTNTTTAYRYVRYRGEHNQATIASEIEFLDANGYPIPATVFSSGSPQISGEEYTKASDGDLGTAFTSALQSGDYVGFDFGSPRVVASIRFHPPAGNPNAMKNGGFYATNQSPPTNLTVITKVETSDGRSAVYNYTPFTDTGLPLSWQVLSGVTYDDGTAATYTYVQNFPGTRPLLSEANDPRVPTSATRLKWEYARATANIIGYVKRESNGVTVESIVSLSSAGQATPSAQFPNGGATTWNFSEQTALANVQTDSLGRKTYFTYDQLGYGFLISRKDALGRITSWTKSRYDNPLTQTNPDGSVESWTRDALDLVLTHTDELGRVTTYTRDARHRITRIDYPDASYETFVFNEFSQVISHRLRSGGLENSTYNARGLKTLHTDALNNITAYTYDNRDLLASLTDARNHTTSYVYNERGLLTKVIHGDSSATTYGYDAYGNRATVTNELGNTWVTVYDEWRRIKSVSDPLARKTSYAYGLPNGLCGCVHGNNLPTSITLPSGKLKTLCIS